MSGGLLVPPEGERKDTVAWVAYHEDWTGFTLFRNEIDVLRCAVANHMKVVRVRDGEDPMDIVNKRSAVNKEASRD